MPSLSLPTNQINSLKLPSIITIILQTIKCLTVTQIIFKTTIKIITTILTLMAVIIHIKLILITIHPICICNLLITDKIISRFLRICLIQVIINKLTNIRNNNKLKNTIKVSLKRINTANRAIKEDRKLRIIKEITLIEKRAILILLKTKKSKVTIQIKLQIKNSLIITKKLTIEI